MRSRFKFASFLFGLFAIVGVAGCGQSYDLSAAKHAGGPSSTASSYETGSEAEGREAHYKLPSQVSSSAPKTGGAASANAMKSAPGLVGDTMNKDSEETTPIKLSPISDGAPDRYLIKNATLTLEAGDVRTVTAKVIADAKVLKGYVSGLHETVDGLGARAVTFVVRVPFTQFDTFLQGFESQGKVLDREVTTEDVTEEYVDTQSKLHNLRATEARLLTHLSKTGKLSDTLLVEKEINRVREEVDRLTGRLKFLAHRISFSTFNITIKETPHAQGITPPETFSAGKVVADAGRSLVGFGQQVLTAAIWILTWSVVWVPPAILVGMLYVRKRRVDSKAA